MIIEKLSFRFYEGIYFCIMYHFKDNILYLQIYFKSEVNICFIKTDDTHVFMISEHILCELYLKLMLFKNVIEFLFIILLSNV